MARQGGLAGRREQPADHGAQQERPWSFLLFFKYFLFLIDIQVIYFLFLLKEI
jgi:hypothetical protein